LSPVVLRGLWHGAAALAAGALTVVAFAPYELFALPLLTLALLFRLWLEASPASAFRLGGLFGLGLLGFGVSWLHISIDQFGNVGTPLAILATALFILVVALFFAASGWLSRRLACGPVCFALLLAPAVWGLAEWLRGWFLSGFPWLSLGYSQIDSPLAGYAPLLGVYGVSWLLALSAGLLLLAWLQPRRAALWLAAAGLLWLGGWALQQQRWTQPRGEPLQVSLLQANVPQSMKWQRAQRDPTLMLYSRMTRDSRGSDLVIWPETAVPDFLHRVEAQWLHPLAREVAAWGGEVLVGVPVVDLDTGRYFNSAKVLGVTGEVYHKRHLVPFGEFLPLKALIGPVLAFLEVPMSDFAPGTAERPLLTLRGLPVGLSICYEDAFGAEAVQALPEAALLVNLSNDAWFGDSLAPHQHLQIARMRALETGRPMLRSTNTGISALIGPGGEVLERSGLLEQAVLRGEIQPMAGATPFVRWGNGGVVGLMLLALLLTLGMRRLQG
jgi:apolipoprotein N-acyltransferase